MPKSKKTMNFQVTQSHNLHDCEVGVSESGRHLIKRRVDRRIATVVELLGRAPTGYGTINDLVDGFNKKFPGSVYTSNDVSYAVGRAVEFGLVTHREGGSWKLASRGKEAWKALGKNLRASK